jgi:hypothetical protein
VRVSDVLHLVAVQYVVPQVLKNFARQAKYRLVRDSEGQAKANLSQLQRKAQESGTNVTGQTDPVFSDGVLPELRQDALGDVHWDQEQARIGEPNDGECDDAEEHGPDTYGGQPLKAGPELKTQ